MQAREALAAAAGQAAVRYLEGRGFRVLDQDWRCDGEIISILAVEHHTFVVVDLRFQTGRRHGHPLDTIGASRRQTMRKLADRWLAEHGMRFDQMRLDVIGLLQEGTGGFTIEHVRAVGSMRTARTRTAALTGRTVHPVTVHADITPGLPATTMTGLLHTGTETRDRVRAAMINSGESWPHAQISVSLLPASLPTQGSMFDLAIALAIMAANNELPEPRDTLLFAAELGLDGRLRPVPGILPDIPAADSCHDAVVLASANRAGAELTAGITVIAADTLAEVVAWLRGGLPPGSAQGH